MKTFQDFINEGNTTFISNSPSTLGSKGKQFQIKKNLEKSDGMHHSDLPKEHYDVYHEGRHVGHVSTYAAYKDVKPLGSRVVTSRKNVRKWKISINPNEHNATYETPANSAHTDYGHSSKKEALQVLANKHISNKR